MRNFIFIAESLNEIQGEDDQTLNEMDNVNVVESPSEALILHDLADVAMRMRTFMETESGDYALGVEMGMQRAADMIDNLIRRYKEGE